MGLIQGIAFVVMDHTAVVEKTGGIFLQWRGRARRRGD
jgi:hypothetical protein